MQGRSFPAQTSSRPRIVQCMTAPPRSRACLPCAGNPAVPRVLRQIVDLRQRFLNELGPAESFREPDNFPSATHKKCSYVHFYARFWENCSQPTRTLSHRCGNFPSISLGNFRGHRASTQYRVLSMARRLSLVPRVSLYFLINANIELRSDSCFDVRAVVTPPAPPRTAI